MRLIDADKLLDLITEQKVKETGAYTRGLNAGINIVKSIVNDETQPPTAYDVDNVVEQLENEKRRFTELCLSVNDIEKRKEYIAKEQAIALAIEIVKAGGINEAD